MKNLRVKNKFIAILAAVILILSSSSLGLAAISQENIDGKDLRSLKTELNPIDETDAVFKYFGYFADPTIINTLERDKWKNEDVFEEKLIDRINKTIYLFHRPDYKGSIRITGIKRDGNTGYKQILKEKLPNGYISYPLDVAVKATIELPPEYNGEKPEEETLPNEQKTATTTISLNVILVYATDTSQKTPDGNLPGANNGGINGSTGNGGTGGIAPSSKKKSKKDKKKTTATITEKNKDADDDRAPEEIGNRTEKVEPKDVAAIALTVADGLAALLFAVLIVPDLMVMRWFHRKKLAHKNDKGDLL